MGYIKRKKGAPTRYSPDKQHAKYGVENWFKLRGINDNELRNELIYRYCEKYGFNMDNIDKLYPKYTFIEKDFNRFASFSIAYMIDNNYNHK